ncbi:N-acetylneuraminate synthase [Flavobacteriales bacterium]|nr:N-acetylneuraminate synthase [Flavobacteriales bacterium]
MRQTLIIAEAGVNHNGDIKTAKKLIDAAVDAGVDFVKFQTFNASKLVLKNTKKANYQIENTSSSDSQLAMLKKLELSKGAHQELIAYCRFKKVKFLSTAFDLESIDFLKGKLDFYKIPSGEITNLPYLLKVSKLGLPIVMSTGMSNLEEVKEAFSILLKNGLKKEDITILHCNTEYPTPMEDANLTAMLTIEKELNVDIGYSDHTLGIEVPIAAVAMGAKVIEKHFTLDRNMDGPDHKASLEPDELKQMVKAIRNIEKALGDGIKKPSKSEQKNILIVRKSIVAIKPVKKGDAFTINNISIKRPGNGISPMKWYEVLGSKAIRDFNVDELLEL